MWLMSSFQILEFSEISSASNWLLPQVRYLNDGLFETSSDDSILSAQLRDDNLGDPDRSSDVN